MNGANHLPCDWEVWPFHVTTPKGVERVYLVREAFGAHAVVAECASEEMAHLVLDARRDQLRVAAFEKKTGYAL